MSQWSFVTAAYLAAALILGGVALASVLGYFQARARLARLERRGHE